MEEHAKKCVKWYCELANKNIEQVHKVSTRCIDDHQFKKEELEMVREFPKVCSPIALKRFYLERIGRPDILCSVNILARAVTQWFRACDKYSARLTSDINNTSNSRQYCNV